VTPPLLLSRLLDNSPISQTSRIVVQSHASRASVVAFAATTPLQVSVRRLCTSIVLHLICRSVRTRNCAQTKPWWAHPPVQLSQLIDGRSRLDPATSALCCGTPSLIFLFFSGHVHFVDVNVVLSSALSRRRPLPFMRHRVATVAKTAHAVVC
jgi:hypothetical protein